jgi:molybdopterin/thiamine biosynthesis adenylyltransferase
MTNSVLLPSLLPDAGAACPTINENSMSASDRAEHDSSMDESQHWSYESAFRRNLGLISRDEQQRLRESRVALGGLGGVGGVHMVTLARLGVGRFTIADPDVFEAANFNRQYGALIRNYGRSKADAMAEEVRQINPEADIRIFRERVTAENVNEFLDGSSVFLDGLDFFALEARRLVFRELRRRGIWGVIAGPLGFSVAWLVFDPNGMDFDTYFDMYDGMAHLDQAVAFAIGLSPAGTHWGYFDLSETIVGTGSAPSAGLACQLCSGVATIETAKIILGRKPPRAAPGFAQFDAYRCLLRRGRLIWGNRGPLQRLKRAILRRRMIQMGYGKETGPAER